MARVCILLSLLVVCVVTTFQGQTTEPRPDPEMKKLSSFVGRFAYEGESMSSPLGAAGKFKGEFDVQIVLKGFFAQCTGTQKDETGEIHFVEYWGHDTANNTFYSYRYEDDDGSVYLEKFTVNGNAVAVTGSALVNGKQYATRRIENWAEDWNSATMKMEFSSDGKTWMPLFREKVIKIKPSGKG